MAAVVALLLAVTSYVRAGNDQSSSTAPVNRPATTAPAAKAPAATAPGATSPTDSGAAPGVASASTTALSVGVVDIDTTLSYQGAAAAGTGIVLTSSGEILTNNHVVDGATSITVTVVATGHSYSATVVGTNPTADVAVLQLKNASGLDVAKIGDSSSLRVGDSVTAVGNAGGVGGAPTTSSGAVTALDQVITASDGSGSDAERLTGLIQMNATLQPGESGGPLYNSAGQVVGMDTAGRATGRFRVGSSTENYAIPINTAVSVAKQIESGAASDTVTIGTPGFLGVELTGDDGSASGAVIQSIVNGTPADKLGLQPGDVITSVDGKAITTSKSLGTVLGQHHGGDKVSIAWTDGNGQSHTATVALADGPAN